MAKQLLKDTVIKGAKSGIKDVRLNDGSGLYLLVKPDGAKWWRFDYSIGGKRKTLSLGVYPVTGLSDARRKAEEARVQVSNSIDPSTVRKDFKSALKITLENESLLNAGLPMLNSFSEITNQWLAEIKNDIAEITYIKRQSRLERLAFPTLGNIAINQIKSSHILATLKPLIDQQKIETAHRLYGEIKCVFAHAIINDIIDYDPSQPVAKKIPAKKVKHRAALIDPKAIGQLIRDIYSYQGTFVVQCAFKITPLLFQRPGEIRQMEWKDIDLDAKEWRYFVTKTKINHIVPLSTQAVAILEEIKPLTGTGNYVFPSSRGDGRPMSDNTIRTALMTLGYTGEDMTAHGFRTIASTLLNEHGWPADAIERQLCHMPKDAVRAAYNRAEFLEERRTMMQSYSDCLDALKSGAQIIQFRKQAQ
ncbi:integrase arm-type DNA-binding domain-containing protein [Methylobacter sp. S3L5C]|uniref:tyrosine-type recombinase/integrase n=1 Tax=Methylobacter sp. S3L5C TaxID=2839024 RepID=UPI001FABDC7D|nr:integrase arm-type DNA-binding domain-containing protein [Methylobacter sp. S3L5C]UOA08944.1 tyrosine-type recombinase/integrase [Methylobacter sp. S3L5C]